MRAMTLRRTLSLLLLVLLAALVMIAGTSCARMAATERAIAPPPPSAPASASPEVALSPDASGAADEAKSAPGSPGGEPAGGQTPAKPADRKIITSGSMTLEVISLDQALGKLSDLVNKNGGFFSNKSINTEGNWRTASITVRIPAEKFQVVHDGAKGLGEIKREDQKGEDVTKQWQDLEARLRIRQAEETSLVELMKKQARLADLLAVEQRLWQVREQIEQAQGELRYLRDQVTLATLEITLNEQLPVGVSKIGKWNLGYHVINAVTALGTMFRGVLVGIIYILVPGAVIWLPLLLLILWIRRRRARRRAQKAAAPPPPTAQG